MELLEKVIELNPEIQFKYSKKDTNMQFVTMHVNKVYCGEFKYYDGTIFNIQIQRDFISTFEKLFNIKLINDQTMIFINSFLKEFHNNDILSSVFENLPIFKHDDLYYFKREDLQKCTLEFFSDTHVNVVKDYKIRNTKRGISFSLCFGISEDFKIIPIPICHIKLSPISPFYFSFDITTCKIKKVQIRDTNNIYLGNTIQEFFSKNSFNIQTMPNFSNDYGKELFNNILNNNITDTEMKLSLKEGFDLNNAKYYFDVLKMLII